MNLSKANRKTIWHVTDDVSALESPSIICGLETADTDVEGGRVAVLTAFGGSFTPFINTILVTSGSAQAKIRMLGPEARGVTVEGGRRSKPVTILERSQSELNHTQVNM